MVRQRTVRGTHLQQSYTRKRNKLKSIPEPQSETVTKDFTAVTMKDVINATTCIKAGKMNWGGTEVSNVFKRKVQNHLKANKFPSLAGG